MNIREKITNPVPLRLKGKIILYGIMIILFIVSIFTSYFIYTESAIIQSELKNRAASLTKNLSFNCEYPVLLEDISAIQQLAAGVMNDADVSSVEIQNYAGVILFRSEKEAAPQESFGTRQKVQREDDQVVFSEHKGYLFASFSVMRSVDEVFSHIIEPTEKPKQEPIGRVTIGFSLKRTSDLLYSTIINTLFATVIITMLSIMFFISVANHLIRPLQMLVKGTREITSGNFSHRVHVNRKDELGDLSDAFNTMAENLENNKKSLDDYHRKLESYHHGLEEKIRERTLELIKREEALRESESKYRTIFENTGTAMVIIEEDRTISLVNAEFKKLTGYSQDDLKKIPNWTEYIAKDDLEKMNKYRVLRRTNPGAAPKQYEFHITNKYGEIRDILMHIDLIPGTKKSLASLIDITERKKLEVQLLRAQKMEAMGTLAGGVAHDLNNVLGVLVGYSELLLFEIPEGSRLRKHVSNILQSSLKAAAIIQDLLTLARRGVTVSEVININKIITEYLETPEHEKLLSFHKQVTVNTELEENILNIMGSPIHLSKTIMNLVSNAAEAMPGGGEITIKTYNRYIDIPVKGYDTMEEGDYVVFSVSDTGQGISPQDMNRIFEPFYTKKVMGRSGTGLGLAVVWGTVKDHGGYVDVQSTEGEGTTFTLYFPITRKEATGKQPAVAVAEYMGKGENLLVVDDVPSQRELATAMLSMLNYQVTSVPSGEEAVEYLKTNEADLVLVDMIMEPGIDGMETYKRILDIKSKQKAIIVSGYSETDQVKETQRLGAGAYVKKPYVREIIGLAVRRELDKPFGG